MVCSATWPSFLFNFIAFWTISLGKARIDSNKLCPLALKKFVSSVEDDWETENFQNPPDDSWHANILTGYTFFNNWDSKSYYELPKSFHSKCSLSFKRFFIGHVERRSALLPAHIIIPKEEINFGTTINLLKLSEASFSEESKKEQDSDSEEEGKTQVGVSSKMVKKNSSKFIQLSFCLFKWMISN